MKILFHWEPNEEITAKFLIKNLILLRKCVNGITLVTELQVTELQLVLKLGFSWSLKGIFGLCYPIKGVSTS